MISNFFKKRTFTLSLAMFFILAGIFLGYKLFKEKNVSPEKWTLSESNNGSIKFLSEDNIVEEINSVNKIIPLEIDITHSIVIDDSWGDWSIFQKAKKINFLVHCSYAIDLTTLTKDDVDLNKLNNTITLTLNKPYVYSMQIDEDKTVYESPKLGLLRFGDIDLSPEEYGVIKKNIEKSLQDKLNSKELYDKAIENSQTCLKSIFSQIFSQDFVINVTFKE
ncbi:MAG: DUF4230 domain-containing protein [Clostridium sp.]